MSVCNNLGKCPIYQRRKEVLLFDKLTERYCLSNCEDCLRRKIRLEKGMEAVPKTMLPDGGSYYKSIFEV